MKVIIEGDITIINGDCREVLPVLSGLGFTSCVTDPPYGLTANKKGGTGASSLNLQSPAGRSRIGTGGGFMGQKWDSVVPGPEFWQTILGVLKPGSPLLAFGGTRTFHRLTCAIEDAGFDVKDCLMWLYGSGFPKSHDVAKALDRLAGATREVGATREAENFQDRSSGLVTAPATVEAKLWHGWGTALKPAWEPIICGIKPTEGTYAANALKHGVAGLNIDGTRIDGPKAGGSGAACLRFRGQNSRPYQETFIPKKFDTSLGRWPANVLLDEDAASQLDQENKPSVSRGTEHNDSGGPSRFYYCAKATTNEKGEFNLHPTVKPLALMRWLLTLVSPPKDGLILDPFMGSGSTLVAAKQLGLKAVGVDLSEEYCEIAARRVNEAQGEGN